MNEKLKKEFSKKLDNAVKKIRKEKKVIAAMHQENMIDDSVVYVYAGVVDDGTNRDGYAQYLCLVLNDAGVTDKKYNKKIWVKVNDAKALMASGKNKILGEAVCK